MAPDDVGLPSRFREVAPLGRGTFGLVYRALDAEGRAVAVKVLAPEHAGDAEANWQFTSEQQRLSHLAHPAFPRAYEAGSTDSGALYYSMELVAGEPLVGPLAAATVRSVLLSAAAALAYLHGTGLVHGDLKPENMRLDGERLRLLDVGLMAPVGARREAIAGTLEYLAPEAFRKAPVEPRADLYALGALAYELWSGSPPFTGSPGELVRAQVASPVPPLAGRVADADPELERLIMQLLAKDPAARPASAQAVMRALGADVESVPGAGLVMGRWVGREALRAAWLEALAAGGTLRFGGPLGIGKSRALDELRLEGERAWVQAAASAGEAPAGPMRRVVAAAIKSAGLEPGPVTAAWIAGTVSAELLELEPGSRQAAMFAAAAGELVASAERLGGLAVGLDDWHLADAASREFLAFVGRQAPAGLLAWAIAAEPGPEPETGYVVLAPLDEDALGELVASRLGAPAPQALVERLVSASGGLPLLVDLLLAHLVGAGTLRSDTEGWRFAPEAAGAAMPDSLGALLAARFAHLPAAARRLAAAVAVAAPAGEMPLPALAAVAGLEPEAREAAVTALVREGVVTVDGARLRLVLAATGEALLADVEAAERRAWASVLAKALVGPASPDSLGLDELVRAARLALTGEDAELAVGLAGEAGRRSMAMAAPALALELLTAAAERLGEPRLALVLPRAEAERYLDRLEAAAESYEAAIALAGGDEAARVKALIGLAKCKQLQGDYPGALAALEAAREGADAAQGARAALAEARVRAFTGETAASVACASTAAALARQAEARPVLAQALNLQAILMVQLDVAQGETAMALLTESLALSQAIGDRIGAGQALDNLGNARLALGDLAGASEAFGRYAALMRELGADTELISARVNQAIVAGERGELALAVELATEVEARAGRVGRRFPVGVVKTVIGQAAWRAGRPGEMAPAFAAALEIALAIKNKLLEEHVRVYRLEAALALGELAAAREEAALVRAIVATTGHAEMEARLGVLEAELARQSGEHERAAALAAPWATSLNRLVAHRALGVLAESALAMGDAAAARGHAEAALAIAEAWGSLWHESWDRLLLARALMRAGEGEAAIEAARRAAEGPHPYALAGAAVLIAEAGEPAATELALAASAMQEGLASPALLAAWGLEGAPAILTARPAASGLAIDMGLYQAAIEAVVMASDEPAIASAALDGAMALVGAERGYWLAYERGQLRQAVTRGLDYEREIAGGFSRSIAEQVLFEQEAVYVADAGTDSAWKEAASVMALALKTVVALPLAIPSEILGVLYMDREAIEPLLTPADMALLQAFATMAASSVFRERARRMLEGETRRARRCAALGKRLAAGASPEAVRQALLNSALKATGAERGFWLVAEGEGWQALAGRDAAGRSLAYAPGMISQGIASWVIERQSPMSILDMGEAEGWQDRASVMALGLKTVWCLPAGPGAIVYLDATAAIEGDSQEGLASVEALLAYVGPMLS